MANEKGTTPSQQVQGQKVFGKYNSLEEAQKGFQHTTEELQKRGAQNQALNAENQQLKEMVEQYKNLTQQVVQAVQPNNKQGGSVPSLVDDDGEVTAANLEAHLNARLKALDDIPNHVQQSVQTAIEQITAPVRTQNQAGMQFFGSEGVDERFDRQTMDKFLTKNPQINETFQMFSANAETAPQAYDFVHKLWKAENPEPTGIDEAEKQAATGLPEKPGEAMAMPGDEVKTDSLVNLGIRAATSIDPQDRVAFNREFIKGTKLEKAINQMKAYGEQMGLDLK